MQSKESWKVGQALYQATVTSKGQITLPKKLREKAGITEGAVVQFIELDNGEFRIVAKTRKVSDLAGRLTREEQPTVSIEEMDWAIQRPMMRDDR